MNKLNQAVAAPVKLQKPKAVKKPKASESPVLGTLKAEAPVEAQPEAPVEAQPEAAQPEAEAQEVVSFRQRLETLIKSRTDSIDAFKREVQELRKLQKEHDHMLKEASKKNKKKAPRDYTKARKATGFAGPVTVSKELYDFLVKTKAVMKDPNFEPKSDEEYKNWPRIPVKAGEPVARTDVTSHISKYIKEHNLQNPEHKREILPDPVLKKIFTNPTLDPQPDTFNYLKLQTYVNHHFRMKKPEEK